MNYDAVIVRFSELFLKGKNRRMFSGRLKQNVENAVARSVKLFHSYLEIPLLDASSEELESILQKLSNICGIASYFPVKWCTSSIESIVETAISLCDEALKTKEINTFRLTVKRQNKKFPHTSMEIIDAVAREIEKRYGFKVDLENFDLNLNIEVLRDKTILFFEKIVGRKGLPAGVSGKVLLLLSGGIDSPVAGSMLMCRGCEISGVFFDSYPLISEKAFLKVKKISKKLSEFQNFFTLFRVPFSEVQLFLKKKVPFKQMVLFQRRAMYKMAEMLANEHGYDALATGDNLGQVSSQTISNLFVLERSVNLPVLRPLLGLNKEQIVNMSKKDGFFEFSIETEEDPCSIFIPKHPELHGDLNKIEDIENSLGEEYSDLLRSVLSKAEKYEF